MEEHQQDLFLKAVALCYKCWDLNEESPCYQSCANEYLIFKKGQSMIDYCYEECLTSCKNDSKCQKKCQQEKTKNYSSLLSLLHNIKGL